MFESCEDGESEVDSVQGHFDSFYDQLGKLHMV